MQAQAASTTVLVGQTSSLGLVLTDKYGLTLYHRTTDPPGTSSCTGTCTTVWPPLQPSAGGLTLPAGVSGTLSVLARSDGTQQVMYNNMPLDTFARGDFKPGDTNGQGVGNFAAVTAQTGATLDVNYAAGWNLIAGPAGATISGNVAPLYTYGATDTNYETITAGTALMAGLGYWGYFSTPVALGLSGSSAEPATIQLPAGHYVMIGNSSIGPVSVSGADSLLVYSPATGYQSTTTLQPGQGAWAISVRGATASLTATQVTPTAVPTATPTSVATVTSTSTPAAVKMINLSFTPASVTISRGTTVTWTNADTVTHTVSADNGSFDLGLIAPGTSASMTFSTSGVFNYHCNIHPFMTGTITVQ